VRRLILEPGRLAAFADIAPGVALEIVDDVRDLSETSAPQGVVAQCEPIPVQPLAALVARARRSALVVLDHIEDPHNLGAVARSALAASATGLVVPARRTAPFGAAAFKAAAGALEHLPVTVVNSVADAVARLEELGVWTVGLAMDGDEPLFGCPLFTEPTAVVIGGEGTGLSRLVRERVSKLVHIPLAPEVESLNASVAAALAMYEVWRVRQGGHT
jgi:23S rRNA (guanosine2251-2'-O)-methyltransferase